MPGAILTTVTLLNHADTRSKTTLASVIIACLATAFVATTIAYNFDTDAERRHKWPHFYGCAGWCAHMRHIRSAPFAGRYMGNTPLSKCKFFCVLFVVHAAQELPRIIRCAFSVAWCMP